MFGTGLFAPIYRRLTSTGADAARASFQTATDDERGSLFEFVIQEYAKRYCRPGSTALDIGANGGAHTKTMAEAVGPHGRVHAFEPDHRIAADMLVPLVKSYPWIELHEFALSDRNGTHEFNLDRCTALSSLYARPRPDVDIVETVSVRLSRLDDVAAIQAEDNITFIKADVEGEELPLLAGAEATINKHRPLILIEIDWAHCFPDRDPSQFFSWLRQRDYTIIDFFGDPITTFAPYAWNVILVPNTLPLPEIAAFAGKAADVFFRQYRSWRLY